MNTSPRHLRCPTATLALAILFWLAPAAFAGSGEPSSAELVINGMMRAHGGWSAWASAPTVSFTDEFKVGTTEAGQPSRVTVEQGPRRAILDFPGTDMSMVWDGEKAWSRNWAIPIPPRFLALLNYHFLNLPWLARDPGVVLGAPGTGTLFDDPTEYITVRVGYEAGVGDTPGDYYQLYIHPETHRLKACEYIVTYRAILPEGIEATDPHILIYDSFEEVSGLLVPTHYTIYELDGTVYGSADARDWSFSESFDASRMEMPEDAVVDASQP